MLEIADPVFGQMCYDYRWVKKESIYFFGKKQTVKICAKAFNRKANYRFAKSKLS